MSQSGLDRSRRSGGVSALISGLRPRTSLPLHPNSAPCTSACEPMQGTATVMCFGMENFVRLLSVLPLGLIDAGPSADGSRRVSDSGRDESLDPKALRLALGQVGLHLCLASFAPLCLAARRQASPASPPHATHPHATPLLLGAMALRHHGRGDGAAPAQVRHVPLRAWRYGAQPGFTPTNFSFCRGPA